MLAISWKVPSWHAKWKTRLKQIVWISFNNSDKLPSVYHAMLQAEWTHQAVESQEDQIIKTQQTWRNLFHIDCFEAQTKIENLLPAFSTTINPLKRQNYQADMKKLMITSPFPFLPLSPSNHLCTIVLINVSFTKGSCSSSQEPYWKHLCCEQIFWLIHQS